jgi:hypothetical protein
MCTGEVVDDIAQFTRKVKKGGLLARLSLHAYFVTGCLYQWELVKSRKQVFGCECLPESRMLEASSGSAIAIKGRRGVVVFEAASGLCGFL